MAVSAEKIDRQMAAFEAACRGRGLKVTHQRTEVFREVAGTEEHPDAETVFERVRRRIPAISRDTVYRALAFLEDLGLVRRVDLLSGRARFDANDDAHHHVICRRCGAVRDFTSTALDGFRPPKSVAAWGEIEAVQIQLRGLCAKCSAQQAAPKRSG